MAMGVVCAPVLDISFSKQYDLGNGRVISWLIFMLEEKRIGAVLLAPPCTTFSPAAWPSLRSYENLLGYCRENPRVLHGNRLAGSAMSIMLTCKRTHSHGMLETPRRSKMRWRKHGEDCLSLVRQKLFWQDVPMVASTSRSLLLKRINMVLSSLARPCTRDHVHVRIQGKFTRPSATYCDRLAKAILRSLRTICGGGEIRGSSGWVRGCSFQ